MSLRDEDIKLLKKVLKFIDESSSEKLGTQRDSFEHMLIGLQERRFNNLTTKQRMWAKSILDEPEYENLVSEGKAPRGREVPTPAVLQQRPLKPPGRK